jgi:hypothetical protein
MWEIALPTCDSCVVSLNGGNFPRLAGFFFKQLRGAARGNRFALLQRIVP